MTAMAILMYILSSNIYGVGTQDIDVNEAYCMAVNIYYEARGEPVRGQVAVGNVVLNRVKDRRYPNTVCGVIKQAKYDPISYAPIKHKCQFSWYCDGKADDIRSTENNHAWRTAQDIAFNIMVFNKYNGLVEGATHYHADYVSPDWSKDFHLVGRIGVHIFYRWDK